MPPPPAVPIPPPKHAAFSAFSGQEVGRAGSVLRPLCPFTAQMISTSGTNREVPSARLVPSVSSRSGFDAVLLTARGVFIETALADFPGNRGRSPSDTL